MYNEVNCVQGGFSSSDIDGGEKNITERQTTNAYNTGHIVPLGSHFGNDGIP